MDNIQKQNPHWIGEPLRVPILKRSLFDVLWKELNLDFIIYLTGGRRVGKSTLLKQIMSELLAQGIDPKQLLFYEFSPGQTQNDMNTIIDSYFRQITNHEQKIYIFFDEIQYINNYESVIKLLYDTNKGLVKIFLTGSLSLSYKRKMEESLAGRFLLYKLFPLNFNEYLKLSRNPKYSEFIGAQKEQDTLVKSQLARYLARDFKKFLRYYRYPECLDLDTKIIEKITTSIKDQSLNQDVYNYFEISKPRIILVLYAYFVKNNGGLVSFQSLANDVIDADRETISKYLDILDMMGLVYIINSREDPPKALNSSRKVYINSQHFLNQQVENPVLYGLAAESYVLERFLEQEERVIFFRQKNKEVDFILPSKKQAFEVKFRTELKDFEYLKKYATKNGFVPNLMTLDQAGTFDGVEMEPVMFG